TLTYVADDEPLPGWAARAKKAHYNAIENLAPFAAVVLVAHLAQAANGTTAVWAVIYFWARVVHYVGYTAGVPFVRTICFAIGWLAIMIIFLQIVT
ncbi:MAG: MAPEG family protein, partial [Alphaproteobacteria bacterium]|nr:MAPEG family protein [Alphaproteobacteria bacterium]